MDHYSRDWRPVDCCCGCGETVAWFRRKRSPGAWRLAKTGHPIPLGFRLVTPESVRANAFAKFAAREALQEVERHTQILHQIRTRGLDAMELAVVDRGASHVFMGNGR